MKFTPMLTILVTLILAACQSTQHKVQKNYPNHEKVIQLASDKLLKEVSTGDLEKKYSLAELYQGSFDLEKRKMAKPLLEELKN